ncbi:MAG: hypothetical protein UX08_C0013G0022 [Candidatus Collierbacteria bacterium GW2011_GWB1_45_35]|uniref:Uncharacterized protein n=1 Tax=Candidatus Collierbacteria bacterium GW2011_GWB2_45_17 TaxID=1618388 RepID=A0A837IDV4_9BACT|nr:MAG: hypothetical protein UW48_C0008G0022 [Microgenomates group bacterium GW2011_GWC1_44_23]KKT95355.1 MAG: hypothetical protein UW96_C0008G0022 [Candidatus Collierbacteria bacterium GW2011_GWA1_45_15]KKT99594.1 MAG: hypothetical protein UX01_C0009G0024 [Candidatus Collierbacteria bacterium GW2011_GWB2_45_17]KKU04932.1 MAG: hypothetical protein UX08_C0013G0022 [Candidatus Collierbacteria bacterium GW2011_GWB1_45_35]KKU06978.1 MAG: hypothetical protein UX11_C0022G0011 [Candidatus Collierbacte
MSKPSLEWAHLHPKILRPLTVPWYHQLDRFWLTCRAWPCRLVISTEVEEPACRQAGLTPPIILRHKKTECISTPSGN